MTFTKQDFISIKIDNFRDNLECNSGEREYHSITKYKYDEETGLYEPDDIIYDDDACYKAFENSGILDRYTFNEIYENASGVEWDFWNELESIYDARILC